ncbi:MAG: pyridoxal phosphate-dependent aminotransferase [Flavobacteriales bacterium]|jgi:aspartate aminotransferase|uniref:pyridoxal phosphate-dependent aminotransferase n=1 Tax=Blattabacterium sp. (Mastotermes darwiniensis) TaxID=39768 RepID=UPI000231DF82|nr:pyridoxal phosphate-dependent aminotransferase [Blattabacterium sp. (Mastotermes darwiniensis)]AER40410.1 aspartate aminotransferase [Blattabacterium sp. (Mastotermes darwiniensis) str. MADAR]MDR1804868.1 pyridoxal phosphate-dependent aminotransferase [Flavobacteriales bacterium]
MKNRLLSKRIQNISFSQTLAMSSKARELKNKGEDIINLSVGEPNFSPPYFVLNAAKKAIDEGYHYYTPVSGYLELREIICKKFYRDNGLKYFPSQIVISTGGKQSIMNVLLSLLDKNDEVIIPSPYWVSYYQMVKLCEATPVIIPTTITNNFKIHKKQLEEAITQKTKLFIFNTPCNPTGSVYSYKELKDLVEILKKHPKVIILSDEIYEHICYSEKHTSIAVFPDIHHRVITLNGLSKAFSMTGWRIGYIGAPEWIARSCDKIQGQMTSCANSIAQRAAISALKASPIEIEYMIKEFKKRRNLVLDMIKEIPGIKTNKPNGAFYIFPKVSDLFGKKFYGRIIHNSEDLSSFLLDKAKVATVSGSSFGNDECLRISYASTEDKIIEAFTRIKKVLN